MVYTCIYTGIINYPGEELNIHRQIISITVYNVHAYLYCLVIHIHCKILLHPVGYETSRMIVLISDLALSSSLQCKFLYINNLFTYRKVMEMRKWLKA